ncbi:MAG: hypothetical protein WA060_01695 [Minisyncoccia bacterium]
MWELFLKIWYFIIVLPIILVTEGYERLKKFMHKHGYHPDWAHTVLAVLILALILALLVQYGY